MKISCCGSEIELLSVAAFGVPTTSGARFLIPMLLRLRERAHLDRLQLLLELRDHVEEALEHDRTEFVLLTLHDGGRLVATERAPVNAPRGQRFVAVGDRENARAQRDGRTFEPVWVSRAVPVFVMVAHDLDDRERKIDRRENLGADGGMRAHLLELALGQACRLVQDVGRDRDLSDIVQHRSVAETLISCLIHPQLSSQAQSKHFRPLDMRMRVMFEIGVELHRVDAKRERFQRLLVNTRQFVVLVVVEEVRVIRDDEDRKRQDVRPRARDGVEQVDDGRPSCRSQKIERHQRQILKPKMTERAAAGKCLNRIREEAVDEKVASCHQHDGE